MRRSFPALECAAKKNLARRDIFLATSESVTPQVQGYALLEPFDSKVEDADRFYIGRGWARRDESDQEQDAGFTNISVHARFDLGTGHDCCGHTSVLH
jgi:hypothetical protein